MDPKQKIERIHQLLNEALELSKMIGGKDDVGQYQPMVARIYMMCSLTMDNLKRLMGSSPT